jgi:hypothetical protein
MFPYVQLIWYYPFFFFFLYIYVTKIQNISKLVKNAQIFSNVQKITKNFLDRLNWQ